ncbi:PREDICTED: sentrin-specific protease 2 [Propithecus coquereli]|uniref:sentrin-specific protease 2 n=1 Tax=Propithecus coquereli TaxID=379532 RepID=UPI00063EE7A3|nr:PREDICTED: sentrin-specific protease 2 [Propithecus coquereli]
MYRWLVRILGTIFRFCDRSVPPPRALLKRRRSNSTLFSTVDTDEIPAKRPRLDCFIHQVKNSLYNAASLFGFPFQLTTKPMVTSACNGTRNVASSGEVSGHGNSVPPLTSHHHSSQRSQMDTLKTKGWGEEQNYGVRTTQFVPKQYTLVETRGPLYSMRSEKRCSKGKISDPEKTLRVRLENEGRRGHQLEPDLSEEVSARLRLGGGSNGLLRRKMSILETKEKNCSGKERDRRTDDLLELTEDMEKEISNALGHGPQDEILSSAFKLRITRGDIQTLKNYHWLNDEVINFYMNLLVERNKKQGYPALHAFSTFFYPKLKSGGYQAVKRWTKGVNLFEQELILVPIHRKVHWSLVVIDLRKKCLKYLDSMGQKGHRICEILLQYLQDESKTKRNIDLNLLEWTHYSMKPHEIPQQLNGSDCGMFTCKYADYISRDKPITFTQHQMPLFRKKMVWEILHQQLL